MNIGYYLHSAWRQQDKKSSLRFEILSSIVCSVQPMIILICYLGGADNCGEDEAMVYPSTFNENQSILLDFQVVHVPL